MPLGPEDVEPADIRNPLAKLDVRTTTSHVRRDRDRAPFAGVGDDLRLPLVLLGVQDLVPDPSPLQETREVLRDLDRDRADQDRLALIVALDDILYDGVVLGVPA